MTGNFNQQLDNAFRETDSKNAAHFVYHEVKNLYNNEKPDDVRKRWIWELLQNAHDARRDDGIIAEVRYNAIKGELLFLHNGRGFKAGEIAHLIKSGTTKDEDDKETHGKFGRGFLTTHLLSPTVKIAGQLDDDSWFDFTLKRDIESKPALAKSLERSQDDFMKSISDNKPVIPDGFTTQFIFSIREPKAEAAVEAGISTLEECAPYVIVFNEEFLSIDIKKPDLTRSFKLSRDSKLDVSGIQHVTVVENDAKMEYLLAENKHQKTSVAVRIRSNGENPICLPVEDIPRLFSAFPLVGTNLLSFPAVINNPNFLLPADRDRVQFDKNRDLIEEACGLLISLIKHAALKNWNHVHQWVHIPNSELLSHQMGPEWEKCIKNLIERIHHTPAVLNQSGKPKTPKESILPLTEKIENVDALWELLKDWQEYREKLPRRDEASGWYNAVKSWNVYKHDAFDGHQLAEDIQGCSYLKVLQNILQDGVCAVTWLDRFYDFLKKDELFNNAISEYSFVPNQIGEFRKLSSMHRDNGIDEELKDISEILAENIRGNLRFTSLTSLEDVDNQKDLNNEDIVGDLISKLETYGNNAQLLHRDKEFREASIRLFAWILRKKQYDRLSVFPVFTEESNSEKLTIIRLPHPKIDDEPDMELPLAPIQAWNSDLQNYDELFPRRFIIHNAFFEAVSDLDDIWETLEEKGLIRKDVIIRYQGKVSFETFQPRDALREKVEHESKEEISVSNIAFLTKKDIGVIDRVRKNSTLARKFWDFLTKCVSVHDSEGLEIIKIGCSCGEDHRCYPAEWLDPVVNRKWIPLDENKADIVTAENLANLFEDNRWDPGELNEHDPIDKLLKAIGISRLDLILATVVDNNDREVVDSVITKMLRKSSGNVNHLNHASKYIDAVARNENLPEQIDVLLKTTGGDLGEVTEIVQDLKEDEKLFKDLEKLRNRRHTINENRTVGNRVEKIVGRILKEKFPHKKFTVNSVHEGADFEITITQGGQKLWVEVKSTRIEGDSQEVKMSPLQAKKAVNERENFLLCVVPIPESTEIDTEIDLKIVRENMWFIANIGDEITLLDENLDFLEEVRVYVTADTTSDVRLEVRKGEAGILVKKSVWKKNGFRLGELVEHLIRTKNDLVT